MGRVVGALDVRTSIKIAATVAVALLAFGAMANPAWAQEETTLSVESTWSQSGPEGSTNYNAVVTNVGSNAAEAALLDVEFVYNNTGFPSSLSVSTTAGTCYDYSAPTEVVCNFGDLAPGEDATVTIQLMPPPSGWSLGCIQSLADAWATNAPHAYFADLLQIGPGTCLPGEEPGNDKGEWVLVDHKGKELCLPKAALNGHERHGDEVISE